MNVYWWDRQTENNAGRILQRALKREEYFVVLRGVGSAVGSSLTGRLIGRPAAVIPSCP